MTRDFLVARLAPHMEDEDTVFLAQLSEKESLRSSVTWMANTWADKATAQDVVSSLTDDNPWKKYWQNWIDEGLFN